MASGRHLARQCAIQALYQWSITGQNASDINNSFIHNRQLSGKYRDFFIYLVDMVTEKVEDLDKIIIPFLDRSIDRVDLIELAILRIGAFELAYQSEPPVNVIIDEAVGLAKTYCSEHGYKFVNGILDKIAKEGRDYLKT